MSACFPAQFSLPFGLGVALHSAKAVGAVLQMSAQTVTLSNGPSEQVWERPWSLDEMRKTSANWSLAADSGVRNL